MADEKKLSTVPIRNNPPQQQFQSNNKAPIDPGKAREDYLQMRENDFFATQGGGKAPSARMVRLWALQNHINSKLLDFGKTAEKAWAHIKVWTGPESNPDMTREDAVCIVYKHIYEDLMFTAIQKGKDIWKDGRKTTLKPKWELGSDGIPFIDREDADSKQVLLLIGREYSEKVKFAERAAVTSAERRAFLKMMGYDEDGDGGGEEKPEAKREEKLTSERDQEVLAEKAKKEEELNLLLGDVRKIIMTLAGNDKQKATAMFKDVAEMVHAEAQIYPLVHNSAEIKTIGHAKRILEVLDEINKTPMEVEKAEEVY